MNAKDAEAICTAILIAQESLTKIKYDAIDVEAMMEALTGKKIKGPPNE